MLDSVIEEIAVAKTEQSIVVSPYPKSPVCIFVDRSDMIRRGTAGHCIRNEFIIFELYQCSASSNPESIVAVLINDRHVVSGQTVFSCVMKHDLVAVEFEQAVFTPDPNVTVTVCENRGDCRFANPTRQLLQSSTFKENQPRRSADP